MIKWNKSHGVILPDIADFPDCKEFDTLPEDKLTDSIVRELGETLKYGNYRQFNSALIKLNAEMSKRMPSSDEELKIRAEQFGRIREMAKQHIGDNKRKALIVRNDLPVNVPYEALMEDGVFYRQIGVGKIRNLLKNKIQFLLDSDPKELPKGYDRSVMLDRKKDGKVFALLYKIYKKAGLLQAVSKYHHCGDIGIKSICLHVSSPDDTHYKQTLKDCKTMTKLVGMHFDPKYVMKSILYLNDVDINSGPFTFLPGSHKWWFEDSEKVFAKGTSVGNYLSSPARRKVALQFPKHLRSNAIVGRFIPDGTELSDRLLKHEVFYTGDLGNCMIFDPSTGFHRGGLCVSGQRINLQIVFG